MRTVPIDRFMDYCRLLRCLGSKVDGRFCVKQYRASRELARVGFLYLRFLTIQLQQAHPPTVDAHELHRVALTRHLNEILRGVAY